MRSGSGKTAGEKTAKTLGVLLWGAAAVAVPVRAQAEFYLQGWDDHSLPGKTLQTRLSVLGAGSSLNFDTTGLRFQPTGLTQYSRAQTDLSVAYAPIQYLTLFARGSFAWVQAVGSLGSGYTVGMTDQTVGIASRVFARKGFHLGLQVQVDLPAYNNASLAAANQPFPGDATIDVTSGIHARLPFASFGSYSFGVKPGVGFTYRTAQFACAIPWSVPFFFEPTGGSGLTTQLGVAGVISCGNDPRAVTGPFGVDGSTGAMGSYMTNAINPTHLSLKAKVGYRFAEKWVVEAFGGSILWGQGAPLAFHGGASLTFAWSHGNKEHSDDETPQALPDAKRKMGKANEGFVTYRESATPVDGKTGPAKVTRVKDRQNVIRINHGTIDGVEVGQVFDIFKPAGDQSPGQAVARTQVIEVTSNEATLQIKEYFRQVWIDVGFIALRPVN